MTDSASSRSPVETVRRLLKEGYDEFDIELIKKLFAEEIYLLSEDVSIPRDAIIQETKLEREALPDLTHTIHSIWQDGDQITVHYTNVGTFENEFDTSNLELGPEVTAEPTGEEIEYSGVYLARVEDGTVVAWANYPERMGAFQQMGVLPELGSSGD